MSTERVTHGRHCRCSACAREDWTSPGLAPCGMHGASCPPVYAPLGGPGTEVALPEQVINPVTGGIVTAASPTEDLGVFIDDARECKRILDEQIRWASREILRRQDMRAQWTDHLPGVKVTGQSPKPSETWNAAELKEALLDLVESGALAVEAVDAAVETVVSYKTRKAGINSLRKLGGEPAAVVNRLCVTSEPERRVSVSRITLGRQAPHESPSGTPQAQTGDS